MSVFDNVRNNKKLWHRYASGCILTYNVAKKWFQRTERGHSCPRHDGGRKTPAPLVNAAFSPHNWLTPDFCARRIWRRAGWNLVFLAFTPMLAFASSIVIKTQTSYDPEKGDVVWTIRNDGDSLADEVVLSLVSPHGEKIETDPIFLDGGDVVSGRLHYEISTLKTGTYALPLRVDYSERMGRRHSTFAWVRHQTAGKPEEMMCPVSIKLEPPTASYLKSFDSDGRFKSRGTLALTAMSFVEEPITLQLQVLLPYGIALEANTPTTRSLPAGGVDYWEIGITNVAAGSGGVVPAAALISFETSNGVHHATEAATTFELAPEDDLMTVQMPRRLSVAVPLIVSIFWVIGFVTRASKKGWQNYKEPRNSVMAWLDVTVVAGLTLYLGVMLNVHLVVLDTLCVGGDTPAHHYLMSHIREAGRIISWAPGWWSGFPMFRYYFPLPYVAMSALSHILPHNVAFKVCSIAGLMTLPLCLYLSGRILRLARPAPAMLSCLAIPLIFDNTHNMWGVNAYSTFAGMIANSWSFALMLPAVASACRDALDRRFRVMTVLLLSAVVLSHFFTSMMAALVLVVVLVAFAISEIRNGSGRPIRQQAWFVLLCEGICVLLVTAWWVLPLIADRAWAVDFGGKWDIRFFKQLHPAVLGLLPFSLFVALVAAVRAQQGGKTVKEANLRLWILAHVVLFGVSLVLFYGGGLFSEVFVNCRFWPFIVYSLLALAALLFAYASRAHGLPVLGTALMVATCFAFAWCEGGKPENPAWSQANHVPFWAEYNFKGVEALREGHVVKEIADRLRGTSGRMAQDLHPGNEWLGSSRIFELMPYLAGKSIIEGGLVNSALGSLAAYTVQGEISNNPAGWPLLVEPRKFNPESGLRHLEFMGVRHFVARSHKVQDAFLSDPGWRLIAEFGGGKWKLFESALASSSLVRIWNKPLKAYASTDLQRDLLQWMYVPAAVVEPMILVSDPMKAPSWHIESHEAYLAALAQLATQAPPSSGWLDACSTPVEAVEQRSDGSLRFKTEKLGQPHVVACTYFPSWRVRGASAVYFLTPGYLVVYPTENEVVLYHGKSGVERLAEGLSILGVLALIWIVRNEKFYVRERFIRAVEVGAHLAS